MRSANRSDRTGDAATLPRVGRGRSAGVLAATLAVVVAATATTTLLGGCASGGARRATVMQIRPAWSSERAGTEAETSRGNRTVWVADTVIVDASDVESARLTMDALGAPAVLVLLADEGAERLRAATAAHVGQPLAIYVEGELVAAPELLGTLSRRAMITGLDQEEAERIVERLGGSA